MANYYLACTSSRSTGCESVIVRNVLSLLEKNYWPPIGSTYQNESIVCFSLSIRVLIEVNDVLIVYDEAIHCDPSNRAFNTET